jgi:hypothetical protein
MKCTMFWHGGSSYACFDTNDPRHAEVFDTITDAKYDFESRVGDSYYPCVSKSTPDEGGPEAWLFLGNEHPVLGGDYPDLIMRFDRFGIVQIERC